MAQQIWQRIVEAIEGINNRFSGSIKSQDDWRSKTLTNTNFPISSASRTYVVPAGKEIQILHGLLSLQTSNAIPGGTGDGGRRVNIDISSGGLIYWEAVPPQLPSTTYYYNLGQFPTSAEANTNYSGVNLWNIYLPLTILKAGDTISLNNVAVDGGDVSNIKLKVMERNV